ncbi:22318_t:CDS:2 [Gigaspora margarita]|uniref:22318_t:CDS:1 n=1 Tax=Gigaspora margarita TaxID=4874 RepID=A0ABM8W2V8_GIGMA|nr:22318_t:CDS:2 [Gigaspora margarita]
MLNNPDLGHIVQQKTFTFQVSSYKYNCVFKGQAGVERIGKIFQCPNWWIKANKFGGDYY